MLLLTAYPKSAPSVSCCWCGTRRLVPKLSTDCRSFFSGGPALPAFIVVNLSGKNHKHYTADKSVSGNGNLRTKSDTSLRNWNETA